VCGVAVGIAVNASNVKGEYSLRYIPLKNILFFCTIDDKENLNQSNQGPEVIPVAMLANTTWEGLTNLNFVSDQRSLSFTTVKTSRTSTCS
jgi:hypothetical protein